MSSFTGSVHFAPGQLSGDYTIPSSVTTIYSYAFSRCQELTSAVIPEGVTIIEDRVFEDCPALESVAIPASVATISPTSIYDCPNLKGFEVSSSNSTYSSDSYGVLFDKEKTTLIQAPYGIVGDYTIPDTVTVISESAFETCTKLTGLIIPISMTEIGYCAFKDCSALDTIIFLGNAPEILYDAFGYVDNWVLYSYDLEDIGHDSRVTAIAYYPADDSSWDSVIDTGEKITWVPYSGERSCFHRNNKLENDTEATCTAKGYTGDKVCSECGELLEKGTEIPMKAHTEVTDAAVAATCTTAGKTAGKHCSVCQTVITAQESIPAKGHSFGAWTQVKAPTTEAEGLEERECACGEKEQRTIDKLTPGPTPSTPKFTDVVSNSYYENAVDWAVEAGVTTGTSATTFSPEKDCIRAQVVTFLWRAAGEPAPKTTSNPFSDVKKGEYYYDAVLWAVENGITDGIGGGKFGTNDVCTRAQVATFLWRAANKPAATSTVNPFKDVSSTDYFYNAVLWAAGEGITTGMSATSFSPNTTCNRAQIVTFLYRYMSQ